MKRFVCVSVVMGVVVMLQGCSTAAVRNHHSLNKPGEYYPATKNDKAQVEQVLAYEAGFEKALHATAWTLDYVPSILLDTILLPIDWLHMRKPFSREASMY